MKKFALSLFTIALLFYSCGKADRDKDVSNFDSQDNGLAETAFNDFSKVVNLVIENESGLRSQSILNCASIYIDTTSSPKTALIDFGTTNCLGSDGRYRRGQLFATFTGKYKDSLTVLTISPQNYYLNDYKIEGQKTITNRGRNSNGNIWFNVVIQNGKITEPNATWNVTFSSNRTREWIAGSSTTILNDDVYLISGNASGVNRKGNSFTAQITTPLRFQMNCAYIVSGQLVISPANLNPRYVDFGSGGCDNEITVTINGNVYTVTLN